MFKEHTWVVWKLLSEDVVLFKVSLHKLSKLFDRVKAEVSEPSWLVGFLSSTLDSAAVARPSNAPGVLSEKCLFDGRQTAPSLVSASGPRKCRAYLCV